MSVIGNNNPSNSSNRGGLTELEQILMQKTFTRSEVDRLTSLLNSKSDEVPVRDEEKRFEMVHSKPVTFLDRKEGYLNTPLQGNGFENHHTSTPIVSATVVDEDVASPAEVAKAYMGSRPSKVSPLRLGLRSQTFKEDSNVISNPPLPVRSPIMSLVPAASGHVSVPQNGFMTPRPRGRSAIYNMARTPYSRVNRLSTIKDAGHTYGGPSSSMSSRYELELKRPSGSQQGALKRRSSVLDNDIGSVGPMRRIRQKANIVSRKGSSSPIPGQYPSSSNRMLTENGDTNGPDTTYTPVPSKSKEMASKILQQLEKLTPKEKSPTKLSPSMLSGKALKSLENLDSSKVFESVHDIKKLDGLVDSSLPDAKKSTSQKKEPGVANGPTKFLSLCDASASNSADKMVSGKDTMPSVSIDDTRLSNSITHPPQKKQAFQMSAHEDFSEMDDDVLANGVASSPSVEPRAKLDISVPQSKTVTPEAVKVVKPPSESKPPAGSILNEKSNLGASNGSVVNEKSTGFALSAAPSMTVQPAVETSSFVSNKPAFSKESNAPHPIFSFGAKVPPSEELNSGSKNADKMPQSVFVSSSTLADSSGLKWGSSSASPAGAVDSAPEVPVSAEARSENNSKFGLKSEVLSKAPETAKFSAISTSTPSASIFNFGGSSNSSLNNGSQSSSTNPLSPSVPHLFSGNTTSQNSFSSSAFAPQINSTTTTTSAAPGSSSTASPIFKFGSSSSPSAVLQSAEAKVKQEASFGNPSSAVFGGASLAPASTGSSIFGFSAPAASANSQSQGSTLFGMSSGSLSSPAGSVVATATAQFGSSGSTPSFGLSSSPSFSFGSSPLGSSTPAGSTLLSSGSGFGASSSANTVSSSNGTFSGLFGSSTQPTKSPIFGSSTGFSFGASSASVASTTTASMPFGSSASSCAVANSTPMPFGSTTTTGASSGSPFSFTSAATGSTNGTSLGSGFSFTSASPTNSSQPVFGFGAASAPANNDQMNAEDSMAEDNVQAPTATAPVFSQQPFSPAPSSFTFGGSTAPAPAGANPFQFAGQTQTQNTAATQPFQFGGPPQNPAATQPFHFGGPPQNTATQPFQFGGPPQNTATQQAAPSPFQASGSLDFNASGNFSLGSGGGDKSNRRIVKPSKGKYRRK